MNFVAVISLFSLLVLPSAFAAPFLGETQTIVDSASGAGTPQVPSLSPDGKSLVYEVAGKKGTALWLADADGKNSRSLTGALQASGKLPATVENAAWHPHGGFLVFEGLVGSKHQIYVVRMKDGKIEEQAKLMIGRRPKFSYPYGRTLFCEVGESLSYVNIGADPMKPRSLEYVPLRGPIQSAAGMEFTHPQLSRDGKSIFFSAGAAVVKAKSDTPTYSQILARIGMDGVARQKVMAAWPKLRAVQAGKRAEALKTLSGVFNKVDSPLFPSSMTPELIESFKQDIFKLALDQPVAGIPGVSKRDLLRAWAFGFLSDDSLSQGEIEKRLGSKIWATNLFGGGLKAVAESAPVPQKFPVATVDSQYVIFESGLFSNRHLYVVNVANGKSAALTDKGTYNSSPGLSPDDKFVYFESNEAGKKQIRKAALKWDALRTALQ